MGIYKDKSEDLEIEVARLKRYINNLTKQLHQKHELIRNRTETQSFDGTIIITDPCYFVKDKDWHNSNFGLDLIKYGFTTYITSDTGFGDWQNSISDNHNNKLGCFCADSGQVTVALLKEVLKYNPDFADQLKENPDMATIIENFKGEVTTSVKNNNWTMICGVGNVNFISEDEFDFYGEEPEED